MATNATDKNGTAVRPPYTLVGIDTEGRHHVAHWPSATMHIIDPATGDRDTWGIPADCHVELEYVERVGAIVGWVRIDYGAHANHVAGPEAF
jgi:hypothetical protein